MRPGPSNSILDVSGLSVGQAEAKDTATGVTVVVGETPMVAGLHVMGGAPGVRDTALLDPQATVEAVDAIFLAGGSAFGLAAGEGVMTALATEGRGYEVGAARVPIVPGAILFDLGAGGLPDGAVYRRLGHEAVLKRGGPVSLGNHGAGAGATTAGLRGGVGTASAVLPSGATVGAVVAVNAMGSVLADDQGRFLAAPFELEAEFGGRGVATGQGGQWRAKAAGGATTIAVVGTDLTLTKAQATRIATAAHDGIARAISPAHTPLDGDLVFACATAARAPNADDLMQAGHVAATTLARAIARGVHAASPGGAQPSWSERFG